MSDINNIVISGRLTKDAQKKKVGTNSTDLVTFDIANNTGWGDYKKTMFLTCNLWGKIGTNILQYLLKGKTVAVTGALEQQSWTGSADGMTHTKNVINCRDCVLLSDGGGARQESNQEDYAEPPARFRDNVSKRVPGDDADDGFTEDIPF